jgi:hypothetical protein
MSPNALWQLRRSPLFLALVERHRRKLADKVVEDTRRGLEQLAPLAIAATSDALQAMKEDPADHRVRLVASNTVLDRVVPRRSSQDVNVLQWRPDTHERKTIEAVFEESLPALDRRVLPKPLDKFVGELSDD